MVLCSFECVLIMFFILVRSFVIWYVIEKLFSEIIWINGFFNFVLVFVCNKCCLILLWCILYFRLSLIDIIVFDECIMVIGLLIKIVLVKVMSLWVFVWILVFKSFILVMCLEKLFIFIKLFNWKGLLKCSIKFVMIFDIMVVDENVMIFESKILISVRIWFWMVLLSGNDNINVMILMKVSNSIISCLGSFWLLVKCVLWWISI